MDSNHPPTAKQLLGQDFILFRSRLLDLAAFLDRLDRYDGAETAREDFRYRSLIHALELLLSRKGCRTESILNALSDPTVGPRTDCAGLPKASGAWEKTSD